MPNYFYRHPQELPADRLASLRNSISSEVQIDPIGKAQSSEEWGYIVMCPKGISEKDRQTLKDFGLEIKVNSVR